MTDLNRKSSKFIGSKTGGCRKLIGHASEIAETPKGHSLAKVQLGRYVQVISLDISTLSEPLRWAFTLIGGMPPCWKVWFEKLEHCWNSKIANLKEKSVSQKLRSSSFSTERVRKIRHRVTRCLHTHTHTRKFPKTHGIKIHTHPWKNYPKNKNKMTKNLLPVTRQSKNKTQTGNLASSCWNGWNSSIPRFTYSPSPAIYGQVSSDVPKKKNRVS